MKKLYGLLVLLILPSLLWAQPKTPVSQWKGKTILFIGAHPDDDGGSHGTMAMLKDHGNEVYVMILTTGNVGTKDPNMTRDHLSKIRRQEEVDALKALGISEDHYINLGYTDGMLEFADKLSVLRRIVRWIRKLKPDVMIAFDPGYGYQYWHKTDHRAASYLAADAVRMAEWRLLFPAQIIHEGLEAHWIPECLFFGGLPSTQKTKVDVTEYGEQVVEANSKYISQYSSNWLHYNGPDPEDLPGNEGKEYMQKVRDRVYNDDGKVIETFRYYHGPPDGIGHRKPGGIEMSEDDN